MLYPLIRSRLEVVICTVGHGAPGSFRWQDICPLSPAPMSWMWGPHVQQLQQEAILPRPWELWQPTGYHHAGSPPVTLGHPGL